MKSIKPYEEFVKPAISYSEYIAQHLDNSIAYTEYVAEQLNNNRYNFVGPQGASGASGVSGFSGVSGSQGVAGATGFCGPQGIVGTSGAYENKIYTGSTTMITNKPVLPTMLEDFKIIEKSNKPETFKDFFPTYAEMYLLNE